jgi:transcriptional regulator with XRE-family HTH domain
MGTLHDKRGKGFENDSAALAATVRCRREAAGLSQNQLSAASRVSRTMLTHVERGMCFPTVDFLCRPARGLKPRRHGF